LAIAVLAAATLAAVTGPALAADDDPVLLGFDEIDFGGVVPGGQSDIAFLELTNDGTVDLTVNAVVLTGVDSSNFVLLDESCTGAPLAPQESCEIAFRFAPTYHGDFSATISIHTGAATSPHSVQLFGTGLSPAVLSHTPTVLDYGKQRAGTAVDRTLTLSNTGGAPTTIQSVTVSQPHQGEFSVLSDGCTGATVVGGGSCSLAIRFTPNTRSSRGTSGTLWIASDASLDPHRVTLSGSSFHTQVSFSPHGFMELKDGPKARGERTGVVRAYVAGFGDPPPEAVVIEGRDSSAFRRQRAAAPHPRFRWHSAPRARSRWPSLHPAPAAMRLPCV
jgi:hypothetical protein